MESHDDLDHHPTSENKPTDDVDDEEQEGNQVITSSRSYECNFCKRGFTNAQALGGHMNIHRKDKAKLKQSSHQTQQPISLDNIHHMINQKVPPLWSMEAKSGEERSNPSWPFGNVSQQDGGSSRDDQTHVIRMRKLPLFVESPIISSETQKTEGQIHEEINRERALPSSQSSSSELDLELRLGPDPAEDSSAATGTRKFF